jgi:hypothetical protein
MTDVPLFNNNRNDVTAPVSSLDPDPNIPLLSRDAVARQLPMRGKNQKHFGREYVVRLSALKQKGYNRGDGSAVVTLELITVKKQSPATYVEHKAGAPSWFNSWSIPPIGMLTDLEVRDEDSKVVDAHLNVLRTVSDVISKLLSDGFRESQSDAVKFGDVSGSGREIVVQNLSEDANRFPT